MKIVAEGTFESSKLMLRGRAQLSPRQYRWSSRVSRMYTKFKKRFKRVEK